MEWGAGRYERIAEQLLPAAEVVVERATVREGMRRIYLEANEDPDRFRITSRYSVAEMERNP